MELPPDVMSDSDPSLPYSDSEPSLPDDVVSDDDDHADVCDVVHPGLAAVPSPVAARTLSGWHVVAEYYSVPRIVPAAAMYGLPGSLSLDILTGWDFHNACNRALSIALLAQLHIILLILSPPCTMYSAIQRLLNFKHWSEDEIAARMSEADVLLDHAMACATTQISRNAFFLFEHPASASSWTRPSVQTVRALPGVKCVTADMCMLGLVSPVDKVPMRKRTRFMTNCSLLAQSFEGLYCDKSHMHQVIEGVEGGIRRCKAAQVYPHGVIDRVVSELRE